MKTTTKTHLYAIRVGDGGEYEAYSSLYEAGYYVGSLLYSLFSKEGLTNEEEVYETVIGGLYRTDFGLYIEPFFIGYNYISLYAYEPVELPPDDDDRLISPAELYRLTADGYEDPKDLTKDEWQEFLSGLKEGILFG